MPTKASEAALPALGTGPFTGHALIDRWRQVVAAYPGREAISAGEQRWTYRQLDDQSDTLAYQLLAGASDGDSPVGILFDQTPVQLAAALALLKLGRIVVVLDPELPEARLRDIAELAGIRTVLTLDVHRDLATSVAPASRVLSADAAESSESHGMLPEGAFNEAAFIVFTSGSTGRPKGVIQTNAHLLNDVAANAAVYQLTPSDRISLAFPFSFAAGLCNALYALLTGASLHMHDARAGGARAVTDWINRERLTVMLCTPHLARGITSSLRDDERLESVRLFATAGEPITGRDVIALRAHLRDDAVFFNWLGSSEMGSLAHYRLTGHEPVPSGVLPAGQVILNKEVRILRDDGTVAPGGESGRLLAVSDYLSGGYWKDDEQNAERFGRSEDGRRTCLQGDLARFDEQNNLVVLGRSDTTVKVRGYLVEPSEIEDALLAREKVTEALVVPVNEPGSPTRLVAYVVQRHGERPDSPAAIRRALRQRLPEYMVPQTIVLLADLPRNERGKIDRQKLPSTQRVTIDAGELTEYELLVSTIWGHVLGLTLIGPDDDFMALGGDSLLVEEMLAEVHERTGVDLTSASIVAAPTLREFAKLVEKGRAALPHHPDVVHLRTGTGGSPIFCFAGAGALALTFLPLSRRLTEHDVFAFQAHGLERRAFPDRSVEATAARYVTLLRELRPHGPYVLLGHSFGGLVALEVARRLTDLGETVQLVGLLDTYLPEAGSATPELTFERLEERPDDRPFSRFARWSGQALARTLPSMHESARRMRARSVGIVRYPGQLQFLAFYEFGLLITRKYVVRPYAGNALAVVAHGNWNGAAAWASLLIGDAEIMEIPAEHVAVLLEPYVGDIAERLRSRFEPAPVV